MDFWLESFARAYFRRSADTAHDLKTPLNVAVLNLALMRMRVQKVTDGLEDEKLNGHVQAIDTELRRMGQIFDAFFLLSTPPKGGERPGAVDAEAIARDEAAAAGLKLARSFPATVTGHEARIRQAFKLFAEGAAHLCRPDGVEASTAIEGGWFRMTVVGRPADEELEPSKIFKFYYTDSAGNPDLSLASARVIAETYGGEISAAQEDGRVELSMRLPLGER
ncbi:MAG: histidine kinase dimerization/phospho-acceptor domain-containing protein [Thermoanaerobaculia bacterium]